jgi:spore coat protein I
MLVTPKGKKLLKKIPFSAERIEFIHGAKEHLVSNGFDNIDRYVCTLNRQPFFVFEDSNYCISDLIEGRECSFDNETELCSSAVLLGSMHRASRGYVPPERSKIQDDLGKLPVYFKKRLEDIKKLKKLAKRGKSSLDHMFLEHVDYFCMLGEDALSELEKSAYMELVDEARVSGQLCHHDVTHHNIIYSGDRLSLINFDFCCFELKVYDVANFIRRKMRKCRWDASKAELILDRYCSVEPISPEELQVMMLILQFPQKFWRVANKFYNSRRSWSERSYSGKLQEVVDEMEDHSRFMKDFKRLL